MFIRVESLVTFSVDCVMSEWSEWSSCCRQHHNRNVGRKTRTRSVETPAKNGGKECGDTEEEKPCHQYSLPDCPKPKTKRVVWTFGMKREDNHICVAPGKKIDTIVAHY